MLTEEGEPVVLLVTSRETRRWIVPKGWVERGVAAADQAALEAFEGAGLRGRIGRKPIGRYRYAKQLRGGRSLPVRVDVFVLQVEGRQDDWPEKGQREAVWATPEQAAALVEEPGLAAILLDLKERRRPPAAAEAVRPTA